MEASSLNIASLLFFLTLAIYSLLVVFILVWVYHDAESRGVKGWPVAMLAFFTGTIVGTLAWLILRPRLAPQPIPVKSQGR